MIVEDVIDQFDDIGVRLDLLAGGFWAHGDERLGFTALEATEPWLCLSSVV